MEIVEIDGEFMTLGQLLKFENIVESGGMAKLFLADYDVFINGEQDQRRGRKLYPGDQVQIEEVGDFEIQSKS
ncbi:MAG: S4 domain-containing protein YaaA [Defluviitaleaceae bacterium]|nr:S4 domain-containing protein YaaA [Defluviitaleaceae bacterium]